MLAQAASGSRSRNWLPVVGLAALFIVAAAGYVVFANVTADDGAVVGGTATATSEPSPTDVPPIPVRDTRLSPMMPDGSKVARTLYPDLDGDGVEDIVALSKRPTGGVVRQPYVRAYIWHEGDWRTAFNPLLYPPEGEGLPPEFLIQVDEEGAQNVSLLETVDVDGDGADELIFGTRSLEGERVTRVWVLEFPERDALVKYYVEVAGDADLVGEEILIDGTVMNAIEDCCPSAEGEYTVSFDEEGSTLGPTT